MEIVHGPISLTGTGTNGTTKTEATTPLEEWKAQGEIPTSLLLSRRIKQK